MEDVEIVPDTCHEEDAMDCLEDCRAAPLSSEHRDWKAEEGLHSSSPSQDCRKQAKNERRDFVKGLGSGSVSLGSGNKYLLLESLHNTQDRRASAQLRCCHLHCKFCIIDDEGRLCCS